MRARVPFDRDRKHIKRGELFEVKSESHARDLERRGVAERVEDVKSAQEPENKMMPEASNKSPSSAGGEAQPSSASPPARRSSRTTAKPSGRGGRKAAKKDAS